LPVKENASSLLRLQVSPSQLAKSVRDEGAHLCQVSTGGAHCGCHEPLESVQIRYLDFARGLHDFSMSASLLTPTEKQKAPPGLGRSIFPGILNLRSWVTCRESG
jgi:hypothetical protein